MERAKNLIILLVLVTFAFQARATYQERIYSAYIGNRMAEWKQVLAEMEKTSLTTPEQLLELINYQYGYIGYCIGSDQKPEARLYLKQLLDNLEKIKDNERLAAYYHGYLSAAYGYEIGLNILRAPFVGPRSVENARLAMRVNKNNPLGYIQFANAEYYMPPMFGGSKNTAIDYMELAKRLMEQEQQPSLPSWNYLSLIIQLANAYMETDQLLKAKEYLDNLLILEPEFQWVKNDIYPKLLEKLKKEK